MSCSTQGLTREAGCESIVLARVGTAGVSPVSPGRDLLEQPSRSSARRLRPSFTPRGLSFSPLAAYLSLCLAAGLLTPRLQAQTCPWTTTVRQEACPVGSACATKGSTLTYQELDRDLLNTVGLCSGPGLFTWPATATTGLLASNSGVLSLSSSTLTLASGGAFRFFTSGSTATGATNEGLRLSALSLFGTVTSADQGAVMTIDQIQRTHTSTIIRTGLHVKSYTEPDNGGDTSGILSVSTGGGPGITVYKASGLRPAGFTDQSLSPQPALEVGSSDAGPAIIASAGVSAWGTSKTNEAVEARLGSSTSIGYLAWPTNNTFDTRIAYAVGSPQSNAQPVNITFKVLANGNISTPGTIVGSNLSGTNTGDQIVPVNTSSTGSQWFAAYNSTTGAFTKSQPGFSDLSGSHSCAQSPALTGDVTASTGSCSTTLASTYKGWTDSGTTVSTTTSTDKVGIGTSSPTALLTISANNAAPQSPTLPGTTEHLISADSVNNRLLLDAHGTSTSALDFRNSGGTAATPTAVSVDTNIGQVTWSARGTTAYSSGARASVRGSAAEAWSDTAQGTYFGIYTTLIGSTTNSEKLRVTDSGHVVSVGSAPTVSCTGTGTSPAAPTLVGTDTAFTVTMNTGTGSPGSTGTCTITFAATGSSAYSNPPPMVCMVVKGATAWGNAAGLQLTTESATAPVLTWSNIVSGTATALTVSTSYKFSCIVVGR